MPGCQRSQGKILSHLSEKWHDPHFWFTSSVRFFLSSHASHLKFEVWRSGADPFRHNSQYVQKNLPHIVALEKKRSLDMNFVLLQMPQSWDTWLELAFRSTWESQGGPSSALTETRGRPWAYRHGAPVSPVCRGKQLPAGTSLWWHNGYGNPPTSRVRSHYVSFLLRSAPVPLFDGIPASSLSQCCVIPQPHFVLQYTTFESQGYNQISINHEPVTVQQIAAFCSG